MNPLTPFRILGIETSCDETAIALIEVDRTPGDRPGRALTNQIRTKINLVSSQISIHRQYGGVVPEVAARSHVPEMVAFIRQVLDQAGMEWDALAVTRGPGLPTALAVGLEAGRILAALSHKPIIGVHHLEGHIASAWLNPENQSHWEFPILALVVSGGHTELVLMKDVGSYTVVGETRDDAAGEAFDKCARLMGLPYPGGPQIANAALHGNPKRFVLPMPMIHDPSHDLSFSGLKTATRLTWEQSPQDAQTVCDLAASLQQTIVDVLVAKTIRAARAYHVKAVALVGGVSANTLLRDTLTRAIQTELPFITHPCLLSEKQYITDNAVMIAAAGYWRLALCETPPDDWRSLYTRPEWSLAEL